jgi:hypothetical protein
LITSQERHTRVTDGEEGPENQETTAVTGDRNVARAGNITSNRGRIQNDELNH